jgi:hypothetical protein
MKKLHFSGLSFVIALCLLGGTASATVIYSDTFTDGSSTTPVNLNGLTPTVDNGGFGGTAGATWSAATITGTLEYTENGSGTLSYSNGASFTYSGTAYLPFTPEAGQVYTFTAEVTDTAGGFSFANLGFDESGTATTTFSYYSTAGSYAYDWALDYQGASSQTYGGPGTGGGPDGEDVGGDGTSVITLDTTGIVTVANPDGDWSYSITGPSGSTGTYYYSTTPSIAGVGFGDLYGGTATYSSFSLTTSATTPEPSAWAMMLVGVGMLGGLSWIRRRRNS